MAKFGSRLKHAWNAFTGQQPEEVFSGGYGVITTSRPDRNRLRFSNERSIITSILSRISIDGAMIDFKHCRVDDQDRFTDVIRSGLNNCLTVEANVDQSALAFKMDMIMTMLDKGVIAIVPVDTTLNPKETTSFDIQTMRVGLIQSWYPYHVRVELYNEKTGLREQITLEKKFVGIVENPLYSVMNEPSSTLQRLIRKLNLLDVTDENYSSGKLDLILQLPYTIKSEARRQQAEQRTKDIEFQLKSSQYGVAYTDGTEKVVQLNRPVENNLLEQVKYLTDLLYSQLGLTAEVMNGTADEKTMLNYYSRTVEPIVQALVEAMRRTFLTKTARTQGQSIQYFRDPFKLVPIGGDNGLATIADKLSRNEIVTPNEIRGAMGLSPSKDPNADKLMNSNMPQPNQQPPNPPAPSGQAPTSAEGDSQNGS